jgi:hypothetical protein
MTMANSMPDAYTVIMWTGLAVFVFALLMIFITLDKLQPTWRPTYQRDKEPKPEKPSFWWRAMSAKPGQELKKPTSAWGSPWFWFFVAILSVIITGVGQHPPNTDRARGSSDQPQAIPQRQ